MPKSRVEFWTDKFSKNILRDKAVKEQLQGKGIKYLAVWECTIKSMKKSKDIEAEILGRIKLFLMSDETSLEL